MTSLSASAIIAIVVCVSALLVTILWTFSGYYRQTSAMNNDQTISHEQHAYMRQVRQRMQEFAFAESVVGGDGNTTRTSQVWSNREGTSPNTPMTMTASGWGSKRSNNHGHIHEQGQDAYQQEKNDTRVNYSTYDEEAGYFAQSPYENSNAYYEYEQQPQQ